MKLEGQIAIVTGGASGLGAATARHLAAQGVRVGILDVNAEQAQAIASEIDGRAVQLDISDEASVDAAIGAIEREIGTPRIAVNCAGIAPGARIVGRGGKSWHLLCHDACCKKDDGTD